MNSRTRRNAESSPAVPAGLRRKVGEIAWLASSAPVLLGPGVMSWLPAIGWNPAICDYLRHDYSSHTHTDILLSQDSICLHIRLHQNSKYETARDSRSPDYFSLISSRALDVMSATNKYETEEEGEACREIHAPF